MKFPLSIMLSISLVIANGQSLDSMQVNGTTLLYHKLNSTGEQKNGAVIFLHGGVSRFEELDKPVKVQIDDLLENNEDFIPVFSERGYDVMLPIAFGQHNWLNKSGETYVKALCKKYRNTYPKVILAGFSDGGTGAYRFFYSNPEMFDGLLIFNGYPQLHNFYKNVDHTAVTNKPVIYASTSSDKRIPYEFLMIEYRRQKIVNPNAYLSVVPGKHAFSSYKKADFEKYIDVLNTVARPDSVDQDSIAVHPPVDGWMENNMVKELYPFNKKYGRQYGMAKEEYQRSDYDYRALKKRLKAGNEILILPAKIPKAALHSTRQIEFTMIVDGEQQPISLNNWLNIDTW